MLLFWVLIFIVSIAALVKSADWLTEGAEKIAIAAHISPFIIGITIVALGTSLSELATALTAVFAGATEIVVANVIGSNIANILLIVGLAAIAARCLIVKRSLIDLDTPLFLGTTFILILFAADSTINWFEGLLLIATFGIYVAYSVVERHGAAEEKYVEVLPSRRDRRRAAVQQKLRALDIILLVCGVIGLCVGAHFCIKALLQISELTGLMTSMLTITSLAVGTSLPELVVSVRAAMQHKYEISLGNIFGSCMFNALIITGLSAIISPLVVDTTTLLVGIPFLIITVILFTVDTIS